MRHIDRRDAVWYPLDIYQSGALHVDYFTKNAEDKFSILARHGVRVEKREVIRVLAQPEVHSRSRFPLLSADGPVHNGRALRVIYRQEKDLRRVITFYPVQKK